MMNHTMLGCTPDHLGYPKEEPQFPLELAWRTRIRAVAGCPVLDEGKLFFSNPTGQMDKGWIFALDAESGKIIWQHSRVRPAYIQPIISVAEGLIFYGSSKGVFAIRTSDGRRVWQQKGIGSDSILASNGRVYTAAEINKERGFYALDAQTGEILWRFEVKRGIYPVLSGERLIFGDSRSARGGGGLYCVNPKTGELIWKKDLGKIGEYRDKIESQLQKREVICEGKLLSMLPVIHNERLYCTMVRYNCCFDIQTGDLIWRNKGYSYEVIFKGGKLFGFSGNTFFSIDAATGERIYAKKKEPSGIYSGLIPFLSGHILFAGDTSGLYAADIRTGEVVWQHVCKSVGSGPFYNAHAIFVDGSLYSAFQDGYVYCFRSKDR